MFDKKVKVQGTALNGTTKFSAAEAVTTLASILDVQFRGYSGSNGRSYLTANLPPRCSVVVPIFVDGKAKTRNWPDGSGGLVPGSVTASFTVEETLCAIVEGLGLELRAEYVVGRAEPQVKVVKKPASRK